MDCPCKEKWKEKVKEKFNATDVISTNPYNHESLVYRRIIVPKDRYGNDNQPRFSKIWFHAEGKDFKFCPHCGNKLKNEQENE